VIYMPLQGRNIIGCSKKRRLSRWHRQEQKKRSPRLNYLRKAVWSKATKGSAWLPGVQMDLENIRWYTKTFKEAPPAESFIITRARALTALLDNMPVFITDHSRIVGYPGSAPHLISWIPTASYTLNEDMINDRTGIIPEESLKKDGIE